MGAECPHCQQDLGPGFLTENAVKSRLKNAKEKLQTKLDLAEAQIGELNTRLETANTAAGQANAWKAQVEELQAAQRKTQEDALLANRLVDPKWSESVRKMHRIHNMDLDDGEKLTLEQYLDGPGKEEDLVAPLIKSADDDPDGDTDAPGDNSTPLHPFFRTPKPPTSHLPNPDNNARVASRKTPGVPTPTQIQARFNSPEFRALPIEKQREERMQLQQLVRGAQNPSA